MCKYRITNSNLTKGIMGTHITHGEYSYLKYTDEVQVESLFKFQVVSATIQALRPKDLCTSPLKVMMSKRAVV